MAGSGASAQSRSQQTAGVALENQQGMIHVLIVGTVEEAEARVVGLISGPRKDLVYGVAFVNPASNPWGIEFPTLTGSDDGLARILLACRLCSAQQVAHLNEIEIQVFDANHTIQQFCKACSITTSWSRPGDKRTLDLGPPKQSSTDGSTAEKNRRKHGRVRVNIQACIRPVSYTHLDVYKRQLFFRCRNTSWFTP